MCIPPWNIMTTRNTWAMSITTHSSRKWWGLGGGGGHCFVNTSSSCIPSWLQLSGDGPYNAKREKHLRGPLEELEFFFFSFSFCFVVLLAWLKRFGDFVYNHQTAINFFLDVYSSSSVDWTKEGNYLLRLLLPPVFSISSLARTSLYIFYFFFI